MNVAFYLLAHRLADDRKRNLPRQSAAGKARAEAGLHPWVHRALLMWTRLV